MTLNPKQKAFIEAYLRNGGNATQAAIEAGYSAKTAHVQGPRLLGNVAVSATLKNRAEKVVQKLEITTDRILEARARRAFFDPGELAKHNIRCPADIANLPDDVRRVIKGWKWDKNGKFVIEFADADTSLAALEKIHGMYRDNDHGNGALNIHIHL